MAKVISFAMAKLKRDQAKRIFLATGTNRRVTLEEYIEILRKAPAARA